MASKRQRQNGSWEFIVKNKRLLPKPISLTFQTEEAGNAYCARLEAQLKLGVVPAELKYTDTRDTSTIRLAKALAEYRGMVNIKSDDHAILDVVVARLPDKLLLRDLTFDWATAWVSGLKVTHNLSPSTVRKHVGALSRALRWFVAKGYMATNPLGLLPRGYSAYTPEEARALKRIGKSAKEDQERDRRLTADEEKEVRRLLAGGKKRKTGPNDNRELELPEREAMAMLFEMALETAMRLSEMYTLERSQIDLKAHTIFLSKTKNGSKRQVPITSVLAKRLAVYTPAHKGPLFFPWWSGVRTRKVMRATTSMLSERFSTLFEAAGATGMRFHDLRHEATSRIYERTALRDVEIASITGHKNLNMLKRYSNLRATDLATRMW